MCIAPIHTYSEAERERNLEKQAQKLTDSQVNPQAYSAAEKLRRSRDPERKGPTMQIQGGDPPTPAPAPCPRSENETTYLSKDRD